MRPIKNVNIQKRKRVWHNSSLNSLPFCLRVLTFSETNYQMSFQKTTLEAGQGKLQQRFTHNYT